MERAAELVRYGKKVYGAVWKLEGLKVPQKQPMRSRLRLNDGSCIRLRPEYPGHVWSYDFVEGCTHYGRKFRILAIIDEASRECLAKVVARKRRSEDVLAALAEFERAMIRERTSVGLDQARAEGRVGGRRPKLTAAQRRDVAENVISGRKSAAQMAKLDSVSEPTISRIIAAARHPSP